MSGYITFEERLEIESVIFQRCSFGEIAKKINKDRSTISREIRRHSVIENPHTSFMMGFLRDFNTSQSVIDIFETLYVKLGRKLFEKLFPVILTDRGSEFSNPRMIEYTKDGILRTKVYYCDAGCPHQKGSIEVNHELIRRVLPRGVTFDNLTQEKIDIMMNHINSYSRLKRGNKTPFEAFEFYYGSELFEKLGYKQVEKNQVIINPKLLKR